MDDGHPTPTRLLGDRIRQERERRSWTQDDLAAAMRRTDPGLITRARVVQRWENGEAKPQPRALRALATVFGLPVDELTAARPADNRRSGLQADGTIRRCVRVSGQRRR
jgi:transcriptional regulator with XRE-family HTH domain